MNVTVVFTTQLKAAIGQESVVLELNESATVRDAIESLSTSFAQPVRDYVLRDGELLPSILLVVNDEQVGADVLLSDGDTVTLLSAISGG